MLKKYWMCTKSRGGNTFIFFERNTGREAIQMYWTLAVAYIFNTGFSFLSLKLGTVLLGFLTIPYVYLLGKEYGNERTWPLCAFSFWDCRLA